MERGTVRDAPALGDDCRALFETLTREGNSPVALAPALDAFCRGIWQMVAADGGRIEAHSPPGGGAVFAIRLPGAARRRRRG
jgi:hypothetical protein